MLKFHEFCINMWTLLSILKVIMFVNSDLTLPWPWVYLCYANGTHWATDKKTSNQLFSYYVLILFWIIIGTEELWSREPKENPWWGWGWRGREGSMQSCFSIGPSIWGRWRWTWPWKWWWFWFGEQLCNCAKYVINLPFHFFHLLC